MPAGNDFCNNPLYNTVFHPVDGSVVDVDDRPTLRGLAELGKYVFCTVTGGGMTAGGTYVCTDTAPDPDFDGGGTWIALGGGVWQTFTPVLHSTGAAVNLGTNGFASGQYATVGQVCHVQVFIEFGTAGHGVAAGTGSYYVELAGLPHRGGSNFSQGNGTLSDISTGDQQDVVVITYPAGGGDPRVQFTYTGSPANLVGAAVPWAWDTLDIIECWFTYRTA